MTVSRPLSLKGLEVNYSKLKKYIEQQGGYDLSESEDSIVLSFMPSFPEALEKGETNNPPRVIMHGKLESGIVTFFLVQVENDDSIRSKDPEESELAYQSWLQFIEDNC